MILPFKNISETDLQELCTQHKLSLTLEETKKVVNMLRRNPTLTEATIWSIQGSEHSSYKSSRQYLSLLPTEATPVILGPKEDAGIVEMCEINGEKYGLVYSHESHNSPSQLVPFEGAATGVGGICRDIACMGSRVIGVLDSLRFGDPKKLQNQVIARGVVEGIAGYGNPLGVPNMGGDVAFDDSFDGFTLVNVVALGLVKEKNILHSYAPNNAAKDNYELIVVGKGSDKSGFGGASFSSQVVDETQKEKNLGAVQEPNPFLERHLLAAFQDLFKLLEDKGELNTIGFKDMGAGGIMCASIELAEGAHGQGFGAEIDVEKIHTGEDGLPPHVILCSETQERFCFAVPPHLTQFFLDHFNTKWDLPNVSSGAKASCVGKINDTGKYTVKYKGETLCDANVDDICAGLKIDREFIMPDESKLINQTDVPKIENLSAFITDFIGRPNLAQRTCVSEQYDQTVQGATVLMRHQSEAVVSAPLRDSEEISELDKKHGFAVSVGGSAHLGRINPFEQGSQAVCTAIQRVAATGAFPRSLTDCLNYGNPEEKEDMGRFIDGVTGVAEGAKNIHLFEHQTEPTPFISGNVSLYKKGNPSAIVSCVGTIKNIDNAVGNIPSEGSIAFLIGNRHQEIGGTEFEKTIITDNNTYFPPYHLDCDSAEKNTFSILKGHEKNLFDSVHVIAEGGMINSLLQASLKNNIGFSGDLSNFSQPQLFCENNGFIVTVDGNKKEELEALKKLMKIEGVEIQELGVFGGEKLEYREFELDFEEVKEKWKNGLRELF